MNRKNILLTGGIALLTLFLGIGLFAREGAAETSGGKELKIVSTIFPPGSWISEILGDNPGGASVSVIQTNGVDMHSFQPSVDDILKISESDLFVYVGGASDAWVEDALNTAASSDRKVISLMDELGEDVREEEIVEGMETEAEEHGESDEELDEHVWLSLKNASFFSEKLTDALCELDEENAETYRQNLAAYQEKLAALDQKYEEAVSQGARKTLLFGDRFPFRYMTDDYGLSYYAAFAGCSAETEASFETIIFLAGKVDELSLPCVLTLEGSDQKIASTIIKSTKTKDQKILTLNSMQAVTEEEREQGVTYLSVMEENLAALKEALS